MLYLLSTGLPCRWRGFEPQGTGPLRHLECQVRARLQGPRPLDPQGPAKLKIPLGGSSGSAGPAHVPHYSAPIPNWIPLLIPLKSRAS